MNILVTGGAGFIGSNFVHLVLRERSDWKVTVIDKLGYAGNKYSLEEALGKIKFVEADICDEAVLDPLVADCDIVVHFAAESHNDNSLSNPWPFVESNLIGTFCVLEAVRKHGNASTIFRLTKSTETSSWMTQPSSHPRRPTTHQVRTPALKLVRIC